MKQEPIGRSVKEILDEIELTEEQGEALTRYLDDWRKGVMKRLRKKIIKKIKKELS